MVRFQGWEFCWMSVGAFIASTCFSFATLLISGPTTAWTPILYGPGNVPDDVDDEQTGFKESELVGNLSHASFYTQFDNGGTPSLTDGTLAFRIRLAENQSQATFDRAAFVGLDADLDGDLDLFDGVNNSGSADSIAIWSPGTGLNISPNTTSIQSPALQTYTQTTGNYHWAR